MNPTLVDERPSHRFAGGLVVVARHCAQETPHAVIASSFNSLSLSPRLVMWCVPKTHGTDPGQEIGAAVGLSVLAVEHRNLWSDGTLAAGLDRCEWLAGKTRDVPLLAGAAASFEVVVTQCTVHGDHYLYIGEVAAFAYCTDSRGLLNYLDRVGVLHAAA